MEAKGFYGKLSRDIQTKHAHTMIETMAET